MVDTILQYWKLISLGFTIIAGAISGYIWLDEKFDGIDARLKTLPIEFVSVDEIAGLARSEEMRQGFEQIGRSLTNARCELIAVIKGGDFDSLAKVVDSSLHVLALEKEEILRRNTFERKEEDRLEEIRHELNRLKEIQNNHYAEAKRYQLAIETQECK